MRKSVRLGLYEDVRQVLDAALASGGGEYELPDHGKAVHWRHRAYAFRKLYAEHVNPRSQYDRLTLPRIAPDSAVVVIKMTEQKGIFRPADAQPDDLFEEVSKLARDFDGDII